jgi:hypothetical protein
VAHAVETYVPGAGYTGRKIEEWIWPKKEKEEDENELAPPPRTHWKRLDDTP